MNTVTIRGATNIYVDEKKQILKDTEELLKSIIINNNLDINNIISIFFTATDDITKVYPAVAARKLGINKAGLMCLNEMYVEGSMENCLRVMIFYNGNINQMDVKHIYLKDTIKLRPDLA